MLLILMHYSRDHLNVHDVYINVHDAVRTSFFSRNNHSGPIGLPPTCLTLQNIVQIVVYHYKYSSVSQFTSYIIFQYKNVIKFILPIPNRWAYK